MRREASDAATQALAVQYQRAIVKLRKLLPDSVFEQLTEE
jgi:hypothetical protein